jgi:hypothetical protein
MADEFDAFLAQALKAEDGEPDRSFVAGVQARIVWEERVQAEREAVKGRLMRHIAAVLSLAAAFLWLARSPDLSAVLSESPAIILGVLIALFAFLIVVLSAGSRSGSRGLSTR